MRDLLPSVHDRLLYACAHATGCIPPRREPLAAVPLEDPNVLRAALSMTLGEGWTVVVTGTLDRRLVLIQQPSGPWTAADLSGQPRLPDNGGRRLLRSRAINVPLARGTHQPSSVLVLVVSSLLA